MHRLRTPFRIIRADLRAYLALNAILYGLCLAGFGLALAFPQLTAGRVASLEDDGTGDLVRSLLGNVWLFAVAILGVNTLQFGLLSLVLPSLIVPFAGIAIAAYRSFEIGVTLAPTTDAAWMTLIPHSLTWLIEFQAYVLLALGAYIVARSWIRPQTIGADTRRQGYVRGLKQLGRLSIPAMGLLVVGAVYEAFSLIYIVAPLAYRLTGG